MRRILGFPSACAFTLIELLTVISIIGLVAGLIIGLAPAASRQMRIKRVEGDLQQLVTAIDNFKAKYGHYPPDNVVETVVLGNRVKIVNPATNQLYYELIGTLFTNNLFKPLKGVSFLNLSTVATAFHRDGFVNSAEDPKDTRCFLPNLRDNQIGQVSVGGQQQVDVLIVPVKGPFVPNTWRYVSTSPTNNPDTFDLWAEIVIGKETKRIGNWRE
jgi:prepilin-type N-terminal cleavage/methylation domain-containing protein